MNILRALAVLIALLAVSNFLKPLTASAETGFVFMGKRLDGTPNAIAGIAFGVYLLTYAWNLFKEKAEAYPLGIAYAGFVTANLFLFFLRNPAPETTGQMVFGVVYTVLALAGSWGAVLAMRSAGFAEREGAAGRVLLRSFALLFAWMALSNALKPFEYTDTTGFVLLGQRLDGAMNVAAATTFSAILAVYAASIWMERRLALRIGIAYAAYVVVNLVLWNFRKPPGPEPSMLFIVPYLISAIGVSSGSAALLWRHRERLT